MKEKLEHIIEQALRSEPDFKLNQDFKNRTFKAIRRNESKYQKRMYFLIAIGSLIMGFIGYGTISYFMPEVLKSFSVNNSYENVNTLIPISVLVGVMLVVIQFLDKKLIKDQYFSN